jgi:nucleoside 2-deoxyribosyltransferase/endonuclease YncB( thermonuclease family)
MSDRRPRIYLAGPEVFRPDAIAEGERLKELAAAHGAEGLYPLDGPALHGAAEVHRNCCEMIEQADIVVANITPFRGHHMDPGTAWELGYAEARGKPVVLWSADTRSMIERIPGQPCPEYQLGERRDAEGHLIEDFGAAENLMITANASALFGGPDQAIKEAVLTWREQEDKCRLAREGRRRFWLIALALLVVIAAAFAWDRARADIRVIDGDTIVVDGEKVRIVGLDAPEIGRARCPAERRLGEAARQRLAQLLTDACGPLSRAGEACLRMQRQPLPDRYGRTLARLAPGGEDVTRAMIGAGLAEPYTCRGAGAGARCPRRPDWCGNHG